MFNRIVVSYPAFNRWLMISMKRWLKLLSSTACSLFAMESERENGICDRNLPLLICWLSCRNILWCNWLWFWKKSENLWKLFFSIVPRSIQLIDFISFRSLLQFPCFPWVPVHFKTTWLTLVKPGYTENFSNFQKFNIFWVELWFWAVILSRDLFQLQLQLANLIGFLNLLTVEILN